MRATRWTAVWMTLGLLGGASMDVGCSDDGATSGATGSTSTSTSGPGGTGGTGGLGQGGSGGTGGLGQGGSGGTPSQSFGFTLHGTSYTALHGLAVEATVVAEGETAATLSSFDTIADDGTFTITGQVLGGKSYQVHWYVDINHNGRCDPAPADRVWTESVPIVTADVTLDVQSNTNFSECL